MQSNVLVINCGSSSIKFALIDTEADAEWISGLAERLGQPEAMLNWKVDGAKDSAAIAGADHRGAMEAIIARLQDVVQRRYGEALTDRLAGIGHRVVHGGESFTESTVIGADVLAEIKRVSHLAPLHNPANVLGIETAQALFPDLPQVAVFDTAFHQTMPQQAFLYAVPYNYYTELGVRRYGFHGTSHRYVT
ncbi:MAG: acetate kinase, partial [Caldilineaceae bacterium]|nr:acetate kinase [Caldilineaceae bacterium]